MANVICADAPTQVCASVDALLCFEHGCDVLTTVTPSKEKEHF